MVGASFSTRGHTSPQKRGKIVLDNDKISFYGKDKYIQQPSDLTIPRKNIVETYLGWDNIIRRRRDTRALIKPLRITFKTDDKVIYLYAKDENEVIYGKHNKKLYELLS